MHVRQCVWAKLVPDTGPAGHQAESAAWPSLTNLWGDFYGSVPIAISLPPSPGPQQLLPGLLLCTLRDYFFFLFQSLHFNYTSSISKSWMFWDNEMFPQVMLLSLPLYSSINRKLLFSRRKLSWFLYSLNLFPLKPLASLLFIFQGYKTKPNAIRQGSVHILNREQGLGSLVKSFIRPALKFLTK